MKNIQSTLALLLIYFPLLTFFSCKKDSNQNPNWIYSEEKVTTQTGLEYIHHIHTDNTRAQLGDYLLLNYRYYNQEGEVLVDTYAANEPVMEQLLKPPYAGAIQEALGLTSEGDSITVFLDADKVYSHESRVERPRNVAAGSKVKYVVKLESVIKEAEYPAYMQEQTRMQHQIDLDKIRKHLDSTKTAVNETQYGLFYTMENTQKGEESVFAKPGDSISFLYESKTLTGQLFDTTFDPTLEIGGKPVGIVLGKKQIIPAWQIAFQGILSKGSQAVLYSPSTLAFGRQGLPPYLGINEVCVFRIKVLDIVPADKIKK